MSFKCKIWVTLKQPHWKVLNLREWWLPHSTIDEPNFCEPSPNYILEHLSEPLDHVQSIPSCLNGEDQRLDSHSGRFQWSSSLFCETISTAAHRRDMTDPCRPTELIWWRWSCDGCFTGGECCTTITVDQCFPLHMWAHSNCDLHNMEPP